jgi:hypothetical protein
MKTSFIYIYICELISAHRDKGTAEDRFVAEQLERVAQLLRFTGATTADEFAARVELNEQWARQAEFDRGWNAGRASLRRETTSSPYLNN